MLALMLVAGSAAADELPTIESAFPPTIRVGEAGYRTRVTSISVELHGAPAVSWLRLEIEAGWPVSLPVDLPRGARVMGMSVERDGVDVWAPRLRKAISDDTIRATEVATVVEPVGMSGDEEHFLLRASRGKLAVTLALALPPAAELAIDAGRDTRVAITREDVAVPPIVGAAPRIDTRMLTGSIATQAPVAFAVEQEAPSRVIVDRIETVEETWTVDKRVIRRTVRAHQERLRWCYMQPLQRDPTLAGTATLHFRIGSDGKVTTATADGNLPVEITGCLAGVAASMEFPESDGITDVHYPLTFRPSGT